MFVDWWKPVKGILGTNIPNKTSCNRYRKCKTYGLRFTCYSWRSKSNGKIRLNKKLIKFISDFHKLVELLHVFAVGFS